MLAVVAVVAVSSQPRPVLHGTGVVALVALVGVLVGGAVLLLGSPGRRLAAPVDALLFGVVMVSSLMLVWIEPNGAGFFGGFVFAAAASIRLRSQVGMVLTGGFVVCLALAAVFGAARPAMPVLLSVIGVIAFYRLGLYTRQLKERTDESQRLLVELAQTREAQVRAATLGEQQRLAREMHDVLAHSLSGLLLHLEGARLLAVRTGADVRLTDSVERAHHLAQSGLREARQAISTLRGDDPPGPERLGILAEEFQRDTGVPCGLFVTGLPVELGAQTRLTLYRVAQEGLTNVRKHADAEHVRLCLDYELDGIRLTVEDVTSVQWSVDALLRADDPGCGHNYGYGVSGMSERAELLGGHLKAAPTATGFRVALWLPA
jgi:signal transduction histidine kinase